MLNVSATKSVVKKKRVAPELPTEFYAKRLKMKLGISSTPHVTEQGGNMGDTSSIAGYRMFVIKPQFYGPIDLF